MAKLVVEVVDASDLIPKDGNGSASPFVEVEFEDHRQRTSTKHRDLNPVWNEQLVFGVKNLRDLPGKTIEVFLYNDGKNGHHRNFLGKVRISGASVPFLEGQAVVLRYPLEKRGPFSNVRGDLALRIFAVHGPAADGYVTETPEPAKENYQQHVDLREGNQSHNHQNHQNHQHNKASKENISTPLQENFSTYNKFDEEFHYKESHDKDKKKKKEKEVRTFYSLGTGGPPPPPPEKPSFVETRSDFARSGGVPAPAATVMQMQFPGPKPEYGVVETRPPLAARTGYWGRDKTASTYDLVEQMNFLYVNVVKARDLPVMDISGSLDPYVEVRVGNYRGITKHLEKNQHPVWKSVFAFSNERVQSSSIEITVKDKDVISKDDFVGKVSFDIREVPQRVPPDSPLAPQWYRLTDKRGQKISQLGEIMLAVWMGTQADEAFPEAWHSDAHSVSQQSLASTRSKVYFSPKLYYLRAHIISAQDLIPSDRARPPESFVRVQLGHQVRTTRPSLLKHTNPEWNEELMFVASEPLDEYIVVSVEDRVGPGKDEVMGRIFIPVREVPHRVETSKLPDPRWFALLRPSVADEEEKKREPKFASRILIRLCIDSGYHVLDESTHFSSDLQPSSKHLRKPSIGLLEVGILSARNLLPMKGRDGKLTDAYCVAKYGNKWVRTRTLLDTLHPRWNEQYTWEVHDPCTVITVGVFDNCHIISSNGDARDNRIGKVRIRLSTLETDRIYTHSYPLLVLTPSGLKKHGELHLAIRFTCMAWVNMVAQYGKPLLPKMHYVQPISVRHIDWLRHQAMQIVAAKLSRAEPPLRREIVEYMLDVDYHMFSLRRSKANFHRIMSLLSGISYICRWFNGICYWKNPLTTILLHVLFLILVCYPELILTTVFLYLFVIGLWNYRFRPRHPPHMDARLSQAESTHPDELDEEFDTFPTSRPSDLVRMRYDRVRSVAGRVQMVIGDLATQGERALSILGWRDPRATAIFIIFSVVWTVFLYVTPFQVVAVLVGLYVLRHPRFRSKLPSVPVNFFKRLPARSDSLL